MKHQSFVGLVEQLVLCHSPYTGNADRTNGPGIFPHNIFLRKIITRRQVVSGPLARSTRRTREFISQVFMRLAGCTDPAAVLSWGGGKHCVIFLNILNEKQQWGKDGFLPPACIFFISLRSQGSLHWEVGSASLGQRIRSPLRLRLSAHSPTGT